MTIVYFVNKKGLFLQPLSRKFFIGIMIKQVLPAIGLPVEEGRDNLFMKTQLALKYLLKNHKNEADWFLKADDDTFIIIENLKYFR